MKTIGLIGGMSWESTATYYRLLNQEIHARLGGHHSARILMHSVDFAPIVEHQKQGNWDACAEILTDAARSLELAGADMLILATNTMHKVSDAIIQATSVPFLHIAEATGAALKTDGVSTVGLLGTRFTMEQAFYKGYLRTHHGLTVNIPDTAERDTVHTIIFDELCHGHILPVSRQTYLGIINEMRRNGAEAVILGCTEIGLLVKQEDTSVPLYDTTALHVKAAASMALDTQHP